MEGNQEIGWRILTSSSLNDNLRWGFLLPPKTKVSNKEFCFPLIWVQGMFLDDFDEFDDSNDSDDSDDSDDSAF